MRRSLVPFAVGPLLIGAAACGGDGDAEGAAEAELVEAEPVAVQSWAEFHFCFKVFWDSSREFREYLNPLVGQETYYVNTRLEVYLQELADGFESAAIRTRVQDPDKYVYRAFRPFYEECGPLMPDTAFGAEDGVIYPSLQFPEWSYQTSKPVWRRWCPFSRCDELP